MAIPTVVDPDSQKVSIELITDSEIFEFKPESSTLVLKSTSLASVVSGELCAENREITLEFSLESDKLGQTTQELKFFILKG